VAVPARYSAPQLARPFFSLPDISKLATLAPTGDADEQRFNARKIMP
jgi:hypothetical protein